MTFDERQAAFDLALNALYIRFGIKISIRTFSFKQMIDAETGRPIDLIEKGLQYEAIPGWVESAPAEEKAPPEKSQEAPVKVVK